MLSGAVSFSPQAKLPRSTELRKTQPLQNWNSKRERVFLNIVSSQVNSAGVSIVEAPKVITTKKEDMVMLDKQLQALNTSTLDQPKSSTIKSVPAVKRSELSQRWREIQGANNWDGLLDPPIDPCLRAEIIRYGEFAQACYDAFDFDIRSKYCGSCRYSKKEFLDRVHLPGRGYEITKFLYATTDPEIPFFFKNSEASDAQNRDSNWIGYIAVATDKEEIARLGRRDIVVAWRGTVTSIEWSENFKDFLTPASMDQRHSNRSFLEDVKVESGFLHLYTSKKRNSKKKRVNRSAREQVLWEIHRLVGLYRGEQLSITVTGHSLGGALALLSAYDITESGMDEPLNTVVSESYSQTQGSPTGSMEPIFESLPRPHNIDDDPTNNIPVTVFSFAAPRVGNNAFRDRCNALGIKVLRVVNRKDLVPKTPGIIFNEKSLSLALIRKLIDDLPWTYSHVGQEFAICSTDSPFLQQTMNPSWHHNLEAHLHLIDGYHGPDRPFSSVTKRDPALVNKSADFLVLKLGIPAFWWQEMNKGLVKDSSGRWVQPERKEHDRDDHLCD